MSTVREIISADGLETVLSEAGSHLVIVQFWASWAPQCQQMNDVLTELSKDTHFINARFIKVEAEAVPDISEKYNVSAVPTSILIKNKAIIDRLDGANASELTKKVKHHSTLGINLSDKPTAKQDINTRIKNLISSAPVILFMKGTPQAPKCGFSKTLVQILNDKSIEYSTFNILADDEVRQGLKTYSDWPTFPQLYSNGVLLGGLDIVKELNESGELEQELPKSKTMETRLKELINKSHVMLFMKGTPQTPRCGFSRTITGILTDAGVTYDTFDILSDEDVRQGLKTFSNWPTYPQLYVKGELIGGLDIVNELQESDELMSMLTDSQ